MKKLGALVALCAVLALSLAQVAAAGENDKYDDQSRPAVDRDRDVEVSAAGG